MDSVDTKMRWILTRPPIIGDANIAKRFAWMPMRMGLEVRWLETVFILQEYKERTWHVSGGIWVNIRFVDRTTYLTQGVML